MPRNLIIWVFSQDQNMHKEEPFEDKLILQPGYEVH